MVSAHITNTALMLQIAALVGYKDIPKSEKEEHAASTAKANAL
jgi:hypothetical protein